MAPRSATSRGARQCHSPLGHGAAGGRARAFSHYRSEAASGIRALDSGADPGSDLGRSAPLVPRY
jgi:hypothetical protein